MNQLLNEVRHDAITKARGIQLGEQFFALIEYLDTLNWMARREGLLSLEEEMYKLPAASLKLSKEIQWMSHFVTDGCDPEVFVEVATTRYWFVDFQGEEALMYYTILNALLKIQSHDYGRLDWMLIEYLPYETRDAYEAYKRNIQKPLIAEQKATMLKNLYEDKPVTDTPCEETKQLISKIKTAKYEVRKAVYGRVDSRDMLVAMRGLDTHPRLLLLMMLSDRLKEMLAKDWMLLEYITEDEVKQAAIKMLEVFRKVEDD